jgi:UDP-N-acetylmuramoyl-tripeptide--D-alanyl-D-alanine ligase
MIPFALTACGLWSSAKVTLRFLQFFQQEEYETQRFLLWWWKTKSYETRLSRVALIASVALGCMATFGLEPMWLATIVCAFGVVLFGATLKMAPSKKPLKVTARIQRLIALTVLLQGGWNMLVGSLLDPESALGGMLCGLLFVAQLQLVPFFIVLANALAYPIEELIRWSYLRSARKHLQSCSPVIVGITGSYGKTSTKHLVAQVLRTQAPTLITPGSVNTLMGVTRVIREDLLPDHRYFVVEMGAYRPGSIRGLCGLARPQISVLTEVGIAHLERFGSIETVAQAKAEIAQALPPDGWLVYNSDNPYCRLIASRAKCRTFSYGHDTSAITPDLWIQRAEQTAHGIEFQLVHHGRPASGLLPVHGLHQAHNAAAAVGVGICLGIPLIQGVAALHHAAPTPHRCAVSQVDGITWIDDSYNSNPKGFRNALEVLRTLPGQRGILVTPGMVELGSAHSAEHRLLAEAIVASCQQVCLVAPGRITSLQEALQEANFDPACLHTFATFAEAREWLLQHLQPGDKVLLENDLPDLHERSSAFESLGRGKG